MEDKYIIKNCPCYNNERFLTGFLNDKDTICTYYSKNCQDCTDCVIKQIVDECKKGINYSQCNCGAIGNLVNILDMLDIQEVE